VQNWTLAINAQNQAIFPSRTRIANGEGKRKKRGEKKKKNGEGKKREI